MYGSLLYPLDADSFVKELAKIDPKVMKRYNIEAFLENPSLEGYRHSIITILHAYVDRRITFKNTLGTVNGNLKQAEARENRRSKSPVYDQLLASKVESEESIVKTIITKAHL